MMPFKNLMLLISTFIVVKGVEASHERGMALHTRDRLCTRDEDCRLFLVGRRIAGSPRFLFCCRNCQSLESYELADEGNREECRCVDMGRNSECEPVGPRNRSIAENPMQRLVDYVKRKHAQLELNLKNSRREFNNKLRTLIENLDNKHCCLTPKCTNYRGLLNMTKSGKTCQAWDSDTYHERQSVLKNQEKRKEFGLEENYCRNPTNSKDGVWCYTTDPDTRWEHCEISFCEWSWLWRWILRELPRWIPLLLKRKWPTDILF